MKLAETETTNSTGQATGWAEIYQQFLSLERQMEVLRQSLLVMRPAGMDAPVSYRPVALGGIWSGSDLTEDDFVLAERSLFAYDPQLEEQR